jgi:glucose-1-phosphate adenylyltransferase
LKTDPSNRTLAFHEKNPDSPGIPGNPENVFASMGNYLFSTRTLLKALHEDAANEASSHDFGRDILPRMVSEQQAIYAYDFQTNKIRVNLPICRSTGATWERPTRTGRPIWTCGR